MTKNTHHSLKEHLWSIHFDKEYNGEEIKIHSSRDSIDNGYRVIKYGIKKTNLIETESKGFRKFSHKLPFEEIRRIEISYERNEKLKQLI